MLSALALSGIELLGGVLTTEGVGSFLTGYAVAAASPLGSGDSNPWSAAGAEARLATGFISVMSGGDGATNRALARRRC